MFEKSVHYSRSDTCTNRGRSDSTRVIAACSSNRNCAYMLQAKLIDNWWTIDKVNANHACEEDKVVMHILMSGVLHLYMYTNFVK